MRILDPITAGEQASRPAAELHRARGASRFVPDFALSMACVAVAYALLAGGASALFRDAASSKDDLKSKTLKKYQKIEALSEELQKALKMFRSEIE